jgi:hypothetical protein
MTLVVLAQSFSYGCKIVVMGQIAGLKANTVQLGLAILGGRRVSGHGFSRAKTWWKRITALAAEPSGAKAPIDPGASLRHG